MELLPIMRKDGIVVFVIVARGEGEAISGAAIEEEWELLVMLPMMKRGELELVVVVVAVGRRSWWWHCLQ